MRTRRFLPLLSIVILVMLQAVPAFARGKTPKTKPKPIVYHDTVITSVNATSITISEDKASKTFAISPFTEITLKGQRATTSDLQPGMAVSVTKGADPTVAARITANAPPVHPEAPKPH